MKRKSFMKLSAVFFILFILTGCLSGQSDGSQEESDESAVVSSDVFSFNEAWMDSEDALLLDVRTDGEYADGHIPGSYLIPVQELEQRLDEISQYRNGKVFVYCRSGNRSMTAASILEENGFTDIVNLSGGIRDWQAAGLPVE
jgi:rhodanese-related sulfurtransferase